MKQSISIVLFFLATAFWAQDISFGVKGGLVYRADEGKLTALTTTIDNKGKGSAGFHAGVFSKVSLTGFFIMPELYFTQFKTTYSDATTKEFDVKTNRIDLPILVGKQIAKIARLEVGPVFSANLDQKVTLDNLTDLEKDDFTMGLQFGAGIDVASFYADARYEVALKSQVTTFVANSLTSYQVDSRPNLLLVSIGYKF